MSSNMEILKYVMFYRINDIYLEARSSEETVLVNTLSQNVLLITRLHKLPDVYMSSLNSFDHLIKDDVVLYEPNFRNNFYWKKFCWKNPGDSN